MLYSKQKVGKSKLSMEVAKSPLIRRPAFILREDYNGGQAEDYRRIVGEKVIIVNLPKWHDVEKNIKAQKAGDANREIILQYTIPEYRNYQHIARPILARSGLLDDSVKNKDIAVFQVIVEELIKQGVDFICLDSLNALLGNTTNIGRNIIESILKPMMGTGVTFLLIHHENSQGNLFGSINLPASFDHNYHLELKGKKDGKELLTLDEEARNTASKNLAMLRTWENQVPRYELLPESAIPSEPTSLPDKIMEALSFFDEEKVPFDDLFDQLDDIKKGTLKNNLKELEDKGLVKKTDGKTWSNITIKHK
jgi:hypothetical protein